MSTYLNRVIDTPAPQTEPLDDRMVPNNAGGYSYPITDALRMHRFLILGSEDGSYYQKERHLTLDNIRATKHHIEAAGPEAVQHIITVSQESRAPRVSPALFCLAAAASADNPETRKAALQALPQVAATGSHLKRVDIQADVHGIAPRKSGQLAGLFYGLSRLRHQCSSAGGHNDRPIRHIGIRGLITRPPLQVAKKLQKFYI